MMNEDKKPMAFYKKVISNSNKNEYRANDNACKYLAFYDQVPECEESDRMIEDELVISGPEGWLMFVEDSRLHTLLAQLLPVELELLFLLLIKGYTQAQLAAIQGIAQKNISKKYTRIINKLKKISQEGV